MNNRTSVANRSIGAILMDAGRLSPESAEQIVKLQTEANLRFGDAAIRLGLLTEADIQFALSKQFDYAYLPLSGDRPISEQVIAAYQPFSAEVEQLRSLRSQLMLRWFDKEAGRAGLAVVGPGRSEGRSHLVANLAVVFSQLGQRTLLIDADMRCPRQHELFKLENRVGLSSLLGGRVESDAIVTVEALANLAVLPAGPIPPNPLELIQRPAFEKILAQAKARYDIVLLDTPGTSTATDAAAIAQHVGGALVLARRNQSRVADLGKLVRVLLQAGVTVVGSILNAPPLVQEKV